MEKLNNESILMKTKRINNSIKRSWQTSSIRYNQYQVKGKKLICEPFMFSIGDMFSEKLNQVDQKLPDGLTGCLGKCMMRK